FIRRPSWLYPDEGCWARAALLGQRFRNSGLKRPFKVFVFGNLRLKTKNSPEGLVNWWYHVVVGALVDKTLVVFDPAIEPKKPLPLKEWLLTMTPSINKVTVSLCHPSTYTPGSVCRSPDPHDELDAVSDQLGYLPYEWDRLLVLGRDPAQELGDN